MSRDPEPTRRRFLAGLPVGAGVLLAGCRRSGAGGSAEPEVPAGPADVTLRIGPVTVDIADGHNIRTTGYNGVVPGPMIRMKEGVPVTVDLFNDLNTPEFVHWHGFAIPARVDGAEEEKSLAVPAHGHLRYRLTPQPSGARFVHSHVMPMADLTRGTYSGQFASVYIEPRPVRPGIVPGDSRVGVFSRQ